MIFEHSFVTIFFCSKRCEINYLIDISGFWSTGEIMYNVSDPDVGDYNLTLLLTDGFDNINTFTSWLHIVDTIAPTLVPHPDFNITHGTTGHFLRWEVQDINPCEYEISLDGAQQWVISWEDTNVIEFILVMSMKHFS